MEINLVAEGVKFMFLGMGIVFAFLYVMVLVLNLQHKVIEKYFSDKGEIMQESKVQDNIVKSETTQNSFANTQFISEQQKKVAAITAAIIHHKKNS
ncbi:MAG: OadG family protein [Campylobacterales bacterium]|nr:OadG family protein [Campylobacterales bacterium]